MGVGMHDFLVMEPSMWVWLQNNILHPFYLNSTQREFTDAARR